MSHQSCHEVHNYNVIPDVNWLPTHMYMYTYMHTCVHVHVHARYALVHKCSCCISESLKWV